MPKSVSTVKVRQNLNNILNAVKQRGEQYIIERHGEPMAAIVPLHIIEQRKLAQERVFQVISEVHARTAQEDTDELEKLIAAESTAVRRKRSTRIRSARRAKRKTSPR
jgi:prevent-host-death family protein